MDDQIKEQSARLAEQAAALVAANDANGLRAMFGRLLKRSIPLDHAAISVSPPSQDGFRVTVLAAEGAGAEVQTQVVSEMLRYMEGA